MVEISIPATTELRQTAKICSEREIKLGPVNTIDVFATLPSIIRRKLLFAKSENYWKYKFTALFIVDESKNSWYIVVPV